MKSKGWSQQIVTMSVIFALVLTFSMVTLANAGNAVGELMVIGAPVAGETSSVMINGEAAKSGRTVFSSNTITTPDGMGAIINFGKVGKIQFAPDTIFTVAADGKSISGDLTKGSLTVLSAAQSVAVRNAAGEIVNVNAGETTTAASSTAAKKAKPGPAGLDWWIWAAIFGGAAIGIVWAATRSNNCTATVSPTC